MNICLACCRTIPPSDINPNEQMDEGTFITSIQTPCCSSNICGDCIENNPRLAEYCPRCQLRYTDDLASNPFSPEPPPYEEAPPSYSIAAQPGPSNINPKQGGCIHYVRQNDSLSGLSLAYKMPVQDIRRANNLFGNDNLIHARHYILIPGYHGPSLSSEPEENEETEMRKVALKRFQLLSKCVDYKMATIYMESSNWDIEEAMRPKMKSVDL